MKKILIATLFAVQGLIAQIADDPKNVSPLLIGEKIPDVSLQDIEGKTVSSSAIFNKKTVLVVYRGGWCPFCTKHLAELQGIEKDIIAKGYQIVAISPDASSYLKETLGKEKINYQLFSDSQGDFSKATGIAFASPEKYSKMLLKYSNDKNKGFLPVPTVYIINENGEIEYMHINPDYKKRLTAKMIMAVLGAI